VGLDCVHILLIVTFKKEKEGEEDGKRRGKRGEKEAQRLTSPRRRRGGNVD